MNALAGEKDLIAARPATSRSVLELHPLQQRSSRPHSSVHGASVHIFTPPGTGNPSMATRAPSITPDATSVSRINAASAQASAAGTCGFKLEASTVTQAMAVALRITGA
jgi:hypothetical protein